MKYKVLIKETFEKIVDVEAESASQAILTVEDEYFKGFHELDLVSDYEKTDFELC